MIATTQFIKRVVLAVVGFATIASMLAVQFSSSLQEHKLIENGSGLLRQGHRLLKAVDEMPSLKLQVRAKRSSVNIFGLSNFDVVATPVVQTAADGTKTVYYNGMASFDEGGATHTYKLVDGVAYYVTKTSVAGYAKQSVTCLTSTSLPAIKEMLEALNAATRVSGVESSQAITCESGKLMQTQLGGETFVICSARSSAPGFSIYGGNFDVKVSYLAASVVITKPTISASQAATCAKTPVSATLSTATSDLLTGKTTVGVNSISVQSDTKAILPQATCGCKGAKRACLFVHGLGQATDQGLVNTFDYFGKNLASRAPCCSSIKYAVLNTVDNAWYSDTLQQRLCDLSFQVSNTSSAATKTIADTIIVGHSMANLMLGGAIATGKCKLAPSSTWVGLSGPMTGSMSSDFLQRACAGQTNGFISFIANIIGRCPANPSTVSLAYQGEAFSTADMNAKYTAARAAYTSSVSAVMCSNDYSGLFSGDQLALKVAGSTITHKSKENDGVVEYQSCRADFPTSKFGNSYTSPFYVTKLNHLDTTFRNGDALFQTSQMPAKWFECLL